jgi:tetratricopeptide (TPR) repeat protein
MGALSTLAMDADRIDLAKTYADQAGDHPEGLTVRAMLDLNEGGAAESEALFDRVLEVQPTNARALLGKGLSLLSRGEPEAGASAIDQGAELFEDHLGSWIAAGWAYFVAGDQQTARQRFEHALRLDPNFAESHGALAVMDLADGRMEDAKRHCDIALRLDRSSLGAALAKSMLFEQAGNPEAARKVREMAMTAPIGPNGETLAVALARLSGGLTR